MSGIGAGRRIATSHGVSEQRITHFARNLIPIHSIMRVIEIMERSGMTPAGVDDCMRLGAGHPMGPLKLLDFVGLDVALAIGESLAAEGEVVRAGRTLRTTPCETSDLRLIGG